MDHGGRIHPVQLVVDDHCQFDHGHWSECDVIHVQSLLRFEFNRKPDLVETWRIVRQFGELILTAQDALVVKFPDGGKVDQNFDEKPVAQSGIFHFSPQSGDFQDGCWRHVRLQCGIGGVGRQAIPVRRSHPGPRKRLPAFDLSARKLSFVLISADYAVR